MSDAIEIVLGLIRHGLVLYAKLNGPAIDLNELAAECGVEVQRIDAQQAKDEAAENKLVGG